MLNCTYILNPGTFQETAKVKKGVKLLYILSQNHNFAPVIIQSICSHGINPSVLLLLYILLLYMNLKIGKFKTDIRLWGKITQKIFIVTNHNYFLISVSDRVNTFIPEVNIRAYNYQDMLPTQFMSSHSGYNYIMNMH